MKTLLQLSLAISTLAFSFSGLSATTMKIEGSCQGNLDNGEAVAFTYYSNFDGCKEKSTSAVSFNQGMGNNLYTGKRSFEGNWDVYRFQKNVRLTFKNSTGNTSGKLRYKDENGTNRLVRVQCEVRDYEYADCEG